MKRNKFKYSTMLKSVFAFLYIWITVSNAFVVTYANASPKEAVALSLNSRNTEENVRFEVTNMLPGDAEIRYYRVQVDFKKDTVIHFETEIQKGYEKLAEVLKANVKMVLPEEKELYNGLMKDMTEPLSYSLYSEGTDKTAELLYEICVYLDTDVGNDYQGQRLLADFVWWTEEENAASTDSESGESVEGVLSGGDSGSTDGVQAGGASTGDSIALVVFCAVLMGSAVLFLFCSRERKLCIAENGRSVAAVIAESGAVTNVFEEKSFSLKKKSVKLYTGIIVVILLIIALAITTYAYVRNLLKVEDNLFVTGEVSINLNDDVPIIRDDELLFEPGMTIKRDFFIENDGTCDVYYKLYVSNIVDNGLSDVLEVTVEDGEDIIYEGKLSEMTRNEVKTAKAVMAEKERRELTIYFHFPEIAGDTVQNLTLSFDIQADAVQARNNPEREF